MNKCNKCGVPVDEYEVEYNEGLCYKCYTAVCLSREREAKAQDAKTISIKNAECRAKVELLRS